MLLLALACWGEPPDCFADLDAPDQECGSDDDCVLVHVDCARRCGCAAVNPDRAALYESKLGSSCATGLCEGWCEEDCFDTRVPACIRGECVVYQAAGDTYRF